MIPVNSELDTCIVQINGQNVLDDDSYHSIVIFPFPIKRSCAQCAINIDFVGQLSYTKDILGETLIACILNAPICRSAAVHTVIDGIWCHPNLELVRKLKCKLAMLAKQTSTNCCTVAVFVGPNPFTAHAQEESKHILPLPASLTNTDDFIAAFAVQRGIGPALF
eukprot:gnl/MRDRNA2_/MRDRNA2_209736_c0_seq1.p1 gnl/MRDRNA2_/MRDRNA2_209736_c0~~gnl/MRDRNA2_/MRDRNA2_209736_c0_seq1.p1  ORF type:complete len:165 (-),score=31.12 gnl/MRDRNA2_/MRDRNA2_209736_c0_seq1:200-694(-)